MNYEEDPEVRGFFDRLESELSVKDGLFARVYPEQAKRESGVVSATRAYCRRSKNRYIHNKDIAVVHSGLRSRMGPGEFGKITQLRFETGAVLYRGTIHWSAKRALIGMLGDFARFLRAA